MIPDLHPLADGMRCGDRREFANAIGAIWISHTPIPATRGSTRIRSCVAWGQKPEYTPDAQSQTRRTTDSRTDKPEAEGV